MADAGLNVDAFGVFSRSKVQYRQDVKVWVPVFKNTSGFLIKQQKAFTNRTNYQTQRSLGKLQAQ